MKPPEYADFDLELSAAAGGGYVARVISSPRGEASTPVSIPVQGAELENVILKLGRTRSGVRSLSSPQAQLARSFGSQLFDAVFAAEVGTTFRRCLDDADNDGTGVRIRLRLAGVPELGDIPWEYLYATSLGRFLVLSGRTPVVRYLDLARRVPPLRVAPPLRILLVVSAPTDLAALDHEDEVSRMRDVLGDLVAGGSVVIEPVVKPTLTGLRHALRRGEYHVLHFIGHGGFDDAAGDGVLAFEDEHQRSHLVTGGDLGTLLHDHRTLRLVVLNACEGARQSPTDPFSGVAQSLVRQGLPAVVAMQFEITDGAALVLGQEFYAAIADGYPIDAALAEARLAVFSSDNDVEWGTPVLYLRAQDGRIFDITAEARQPAPTAQSEATQRTQPSTPPPPPETEVGVSTHAAAPVPLHEDPDYPTAMAAYFTRRWDLAVALLSELSARHPSEAAVTARLTEARRMLERSALDAAAREAADREDWAAALAALEQLGRSGHDVPDLASRLEQARARKRISDLVADLRALHATGHWEAVLAVAGELAELDADAADPDGLATGAKEALLESDRSARYGSGLHHLGLGEWEEAKRVFEGLQQDSPDYRDTALLLVRAETEIHFTKGLRAQEARQWKKAIWRYRAVLRADPNHSDAGFRLDACTREVERHECLVRIRDGLRARQEALAAAERQRSHRPKPPSSATKPSAHKPPRHRKRRPKPLAASPILEVGQWVVALAASPDGSAIALGCRKWLRLYDLASRELVWQQAAASWLSDVSAVAFHPDGSRIAARSGADVSFWDVARGEKVGSIPHGGGTIGGLALAFGSSGATLVVVTEPNRTQILDAASGTQLSQFAHEAWRTGRGSLSADGERLAIAYEEAVRIYATRTGQIERAVKRRPGLLSLSREGRTLATWSDNTIELWDVGSGARLVEATAVPTEGPTVMGYGSEPHRLFFGGAFPRLLAVDLPT